MEKIDGIKGDNFSRHKHTRSTIQLHNLPRHIDGFDLQKLQEPTLIRVEWFIPIEQESETHIVEVNKEMSKENKESEDKKMWEEGRQVIINLNKKEPEPEPELFPLLKDVIGQGEAKRKGQEILLTFKRNDLLDYYGVQSTKGVLLHGPPGTGKSMLVEALCNEANMIFYPLDIASIGDIYVNSGVRNLMNTYDGLLAAINAEENRLGKKQYGVFYIDECETLLGKRMARTGSSNEDSKVTNTLCEIIDGPYKHEQVLYFATTNRKDLIDPAFLRAGRFETHIEMKPPLKEDLMMLYYHYAHVYRKKDDKFNFRGLDYEALADASKGFVGADVAHVMRESVRTRLFDYLLKNEKGNKDLYVTMKQLGDTINRHTLQKESGEFKGVGRIGFER